MTHRSPAARLSTTWSSIRVSGDIVTSARRILAGARCPQGVDLPLGERQARDRSRDLRAAPAARRRAASEGDPRGRLAPAAAPPSPPRQDGDAEGRLLRRPAPILMDRIPPPPAPTP